MSDINIYEGLWTNWGHGRYLGSTLTVPSAAGGYLIAFLALFITFSLGQLWGTICYGCHFLLSSFATRDEFYYKHQALLRSGLPALDFARSMFGVLGPWRGGHASRPRHKTGVLMMIFAVVFKACTVAAGLFGSLVAVTGGIALMLPSHCGWPSHPHDEYDLLINSALYIPGVRIFENARAYVQKCYAPSANPNGASCDSFVKPSLQRTVLADLACPFADGICDSRGINITSAFIDSHEDLGINARPEDRIRVRKSMTCAVLDAENPKYNSGWVVQPPELRSASEPLFDSPGVGFMLYRLGSQIILSQKAPYTFYFSNVSKPYTEYQTQVFAASPSEPTEDYSFEPIGELLRDKALIFLWVLENRIAFIDQVRDPWFQALQKDLNDNRTVWRSSKAARVIGCAEYYEFCNTTHCLEPLSIPIRAELFPGLDSLNYNQNQMATFRYLQRAALYGRSYVAAMLLQGELLLARPKVFHDPIFGSSGISLPVPDNQWELEVDNLFNTTLAFLQHMTVEHASQSNISVDEDRTLWDFIVKEDYPGSEGVCQSQMVRSSAHYSINVVGLACILGIGGLFIALSWTITSLVPLIHVKLWKCDVCRQQLEWEENSLFVLLRMALESRRTAAEAAGEAATTDIVRLGGAQRAAIQN